MILLLLLLPILLPIAIVATAAFYFYRLPRGKSSGKFINIPVGHRGCRFLGVPENSLSSFKTAIDYGCQAIELDCRLSADKEIIVIHDDAIARVCSTPTSASGKKFISDMTLEEVKALRYKDWNTTEMVPTLEEVFNLCIATNTKIFVELKCLTPTEAVELSRKVVELFEKYQAWDFACVITFHPIAAYCVRKYNPLIETCILYCNNFYQHGVANGHEKQHTLIKHTAYYLDLLLLNIASNLVVAITGCTMIGPDITTLAKSEIKYYQTVLNLDIYGWVANTTHEMDYYLNQGCSVGTDFIFPKAVDPVIIKHQVHQENVQAAKTIMAYYPQTASNVKTLAFTPQQFQIEKYNLSSQQVVQRSTPPTTPISNIATTETADGVKPGMKLD